MLFLVKDKRDWFAFYKGLQSIDSSISGHCDIRVIRRLLICNKFRSYLLRFIKLSCTLVYWFLSIQSWKFGGEIYGDFMVTISPLEFTRWQGYIADLNLKYNLDHLPSYIEARYPRSDVKNENVVNWLLSDGCTKDTNRIVPADRVLISYTQRILRIKILEVQIIQRTAV